MNVQVALDRDVHEGGFPKWPTNSDWMHAFPGHGPMNPEQLEIKGTKRGRQAED